MATIYRHKAGWRAQVRRGGKMRSKILPTKREAERWGREVEAQLETEPLALTEKTLRVLLERYRDEVCPLHRGSKWDVARVDLILRTVDFADVPAGEVGAEHWRRWRDARLKQVSGASVNREMNLLSGFYTYAIKEWGVRLPGNPVREVKRPSRGKPRTRRVTDEEVAKLWEVSGVDRTVPPTNQKQMVPWMVEFAVETAMRLSELCRLQWRDVHLEEGWVHVRDTKNGTDREAALTPRAAEILRTLHQAPLGTDVFARNPGTVGVYYRTLVREAGVVGLRFHDARREAATRLAASLDVLDLAAQTGHRDVNTLRRVYYAPTGRELAKKLRRGS